MPPCCGLVEGSKYGVTVQLQAQRSYGSMLAGTQQPSERLLRLQPTKLAFRQDACCRYGSNGWEVVFGYDQEKMMGDRASAALVIDLKDVDSKQSTPAMSMV